MSTTTTEYLDPRTFNVPPYQRNIDDRRVNKIATDFNDIKFGAVSVIRRADGSLWVADGNHRRTAAILAGRDKVLAIVHTGLSFEEEAEMFLGTNDGRRVHAIDRFKARVMAGEPVAVQIDSTLNRHGWDVKTGKTERAMASVDALDNIYKGLGITGRQPGIELVDATIDVITKAWGHNRDGGHNFILRGLAKVIARYEGQINLDLLADKLARTTPVTLVAEGKATADALGCTKDIGVARRIVQLYNRGQRKNQINDWVWSR